MRQHDDEQRDQHGDQALASRAEGSGAHPPTEAVTTGTAAQVIELVEVGVLAEGRTHAPRQDRDLADLFVAGARTGDGDGIGGIQTLVRETAQVARKAGATPQLQAAHLGVGKQTVFGQLATS